MPISHYQAVLFDLDGTLLDTAPDFSTALNKLLVSRSRAALPDARIRALVSAGAAALLVDAFECAADSPEFAQLRVEFLQLYHQHLSQQTRPYPSLIGVLARLGAQGIPWGIVTNKPLLYTSAILRDLALTPAPAVVICPEHVVNAKPHPEPIMLACEQLGVAPTATIYIGDHRRDIESGISAGATTIAAAYGYIGTDDDPANWGAHYLIHRPQQLASLLF